MAQALIGLGSNIEPRREYLRLAVEHLQRAPLRLLALSSVYETEAMDVLDQAPFLNMAASIETELEALDLLRHLQSIEQKAHKKVLIRRGPRSLDLDLWSWETAVMESEDLILPHPRMAERPFVLIPLREIAETWRHPLNGLNAAEMLQRLPKPWPAVNLLGSL
jgi:2-amino-4-hydroxy-6-hydroxymethyldihydropteridine diphosphokinase